MVLAGVALRQEDSEHPGDDHPDAVVGMPSEAAAPTELALGETTNPEASPAQTRHDSEHQEVQGVFVDEFCTVSP